MKKIFGIVSFICITTFTHAQHDMSSMSGMSKPSTQITYTCPMHPEIHATKAGNCPKCGMALVKKKSAVLPKKEKASVLKSTDSSNHKGMDMQKTPSAGGSQPASYTCPMHPEIHSAQPGNCPKCGMKLVKEQPKTTTVEVEKMDMPSNGNETENMAHMSMAINAIDTLMGYKYIESAERPHIVRYDLYIKDTIVTYGNKRKRAIAANGQIPMPTLTFTEGDTAEIWVHNELNEETALHWHGLFVPNNMDGVPYLTQRPIKKHSTFIYKFPIKQHGTHWYHSHSKLQEQIGMYGSFIMNKRKEWSIPTIPVVISEWTNMKPEEVHRSLRSATDWFGIQKKSTQSYSEAINSGHLKTKLTNEWKRMNAMDVSDVYYDNFLVNGKNQNEQKQFIAGDKVRLRVANGGATDNFWLSYAGGKITIVATDGNDVEPVEVDRFLIAVSETFDLIVTIPENKSYEFLFTPEDRSKYASLWLGIGEKVAAKKLPRLKYFAGMKMMNEMMDTNGNMVEMEGMQMTNQVMDMNTVMYPEITGEEKPAEETGMKKDTIKNNNQGMPGMDMSSMNADIVTLNYTMLKAVNKTT
ncbi:MAG: multicopper oxidase domain-containing protein, partial [Ferruginibacter sp.]